jgi:hypothetical protein
MLGPLDVCPASELYYCVHHMVAAGFFSGFLGGYAQVTQRLCRLGHSPDPTAKVCITLKSSISQGELGEFSCPLIPLPSPLI